MSKTVMSSRALELHLVCTPVPDRQTLELSGRASCRSPKPPAAPVRMVVTALPSGRPDAGSINTIVA